MLLLDEPYSNLDADGIALMNAVIRASGAAAALVVLHELAPAAGILDRTVTISVDGRSAAAGGARHRRAPWAPDGVAR